MKMVFLILAMIVGAVRAQTPTPSLLLHPTNPPRPVQPPALEGRIDTHEILARHEEFKKLFQELMARRTAGLGQSHPVVLALRTQLNVLAQEEDLRRLQLRRRLADLAKIRGHYEDTGLATPWQHIELHRQTTDLTTTLDALDKKLE